MKSMTGYAARDALGRRWDIRSVNARGLDIRLRLPEAPSGLEPLARRMISARVGRGNVTLSLREDAAETGTARLDAVALERAVEAVATATAAANARGLTLAPSSASDLLSLRGVWDARAGVADALTTEAFEAELSALLEAFETDRTREGAALAELLRTQIDGIEALVHAAIDLGPQRATHQARALSDALERLADATSETALDEGRLLQEIAVLAVKGDITEELDRLTVHIAAARELCAAEGPIGRRFDFLTQEFNREANTLCSKSQMPELTAIGLDLKTAIDRLREQVQNVE